MNETIRELLYRLIEEDGMDPEAAAEKALSMVPRRELVEWIRPLVTTEARRLERDRVRRVEDAAFSHPAVLGTESVHAPPGGEHRMTRAEARKQLVASRFALPNGTWVLWGTASSDEHRERARWQRERAATVSEDARRHEFAADLIEKHGVSCLDDLGDWGRLLNGDAA